MTELFSSHVHSPPDQSNWEHQRSHTGVSHSPRPDNLETPSQPRSTSAETAYGYGWSLSVSHRCGETIDEYIAGECSPALMFPQNQRLKLRPDVVVGLQTGHIKSSAPCRWERLAIYNRLLQIERLFKRLLKAKGHLTKLAGVELRRAAAF